MQSLSIKKLYILILLPAVLLIIGFLLNEDLSTGGSKLDFVRTTPIIIDFANFGIAAAPNKTKITNAIIINSVDPNIKKHPPLKTFQVKSFAHKQPDRPD